MSSVHWVKDEQVAFSAMLPLQPNYSEGVAFVLQIDWRQMCLTDGAKLVGGSPGIKVALNSIEKALVCLGSTARDVGELANILHRNV